ncbi:hypothetical protein K6U06_21430 [Acidiferrimicrobium sp. IK]|nr:hypothetical protein [Acidiferrimicrobium sp. IK]
MTAAVLAASVAAAGCGVAHPGITNGAVSGCFKALPAARAAVHDPGAHLLGVHRLPADAVPARLKSQPSTPGEIDTTVCAVAFKGPFSAGQVAGAAPGAYGRYAVVLVNATKLTVLRSYVGDRLPRNLKGRTL